MSEIKQGYKQTDIGVIPEDWEVGKLEELITVLTDFTANGSFASLAENVTYLETPSYARLVRLTDIRANFKNTGVYLSKDSYDFLKKSKLFGDELLLANVGAYAGYSFLYPSGLYFIGTLGPNMFLIKFDDKALNSRYAYYCFTNGIIFQQLLSKAASSAQPKLNKQNVRECDIIYPANLSEQTAIATALSDTDALIAALDKKIAKKQQIKQGTMQQLLTGKKRLSGFSGEWVEKLIGDTLSIRHGHDQKQVECVNGKYPILGTGGIIGKTNTPLYSKESVLIGRKGTIDKPYYFDTPFWTVDTLFYSEINSGYDAKYLFYIFNLIDWYLYNEASGVPSLNAKVIESIKINIPKNKSEQTAIAQILTDMDNEIAQLEKERDKYKELKAGMMQVLLTGKVRLV